MKKDALVLAVSICDGRSIGDKLYVQEAFWLLNIWSRRREERQSRRLIGVYAAFADALP